MVSITVVAPDISCEHCQRTIETALGEMAGVTAVSVDIGTKAVQVDFDEAQTSRDEIVAKLDDEGFPVAA